LSERSESWTRSNGVGTEEIYEEAVRSVFGLVGRRVTVSVALIGDDGEAAVFSELTETHTRG
jgi:hypothetical protein